jgi:hypothetical protein
VSPDAGVTQRELLGDPDTGDRLAVGKHVQHGVGLLGGQPGRPAGVAGQQGFGRSSVVLRLWMCARNSAQVRNPGSRFIRFWRPRVR